MVSLSLPLSPSLSLPLSLSEQLLSGAGAAAPEGSRSSCSQEQLLLLGAAALRRSGAPREWCERPCRADWTAVEGIVLIVFFGRVAS